MQTFLVTVLTFISTTLYGPEADFSEPVEPETSVKKETSEPQQERNTREIETC